MISFGLLAFADAGLLLVDAHGVHNLVVVPWAHAVSVRAEQLAVAPQEVRQVVRLYDLEQVLLVAAALDGDLLTCLLVNEALDDGPDAREEHRRVHDEGLAHGFGVVVAPDLRGQLNERVDLLREDLHRPVVQVQDAQTLLHAVAGDGRTGRESEAEQGLVALDVVFDKALLGGQLEDLVDLHQAQALDVDGPPLLVCLVVEMRVHCLQMV